MRADLAIEKLCRQYDFQTVLDIGSGKGEHSKYFESKSRLVTSIDLEACGDFVPFIIGDYVKTVFTSKFECIWCCHVLEHIVNPGAFLDKIFDDLDEGGILAITVPPLKHQIVSGHVSLWNAGLLIYHLVQAGFDCRAAAVKSYGYNISVIVRKVPNGVRRGGRRLANVGRFFPVPMRDGTDGRIGEVNW